MNFECRLCGSYMNVDVDGCVYYFDCPYCENYSGKMLDSQDLIEEYVMLKNTFTLCNRGGKSVLYDNKGFVATLYTCLSFEDTIKWAEKQIKLLNF